MQQTINIKFCVKLGKLFTETLKLLRKTAYRDQTLSRTVVYEWFTKFRDGRESLEDDKRSETAIDQSNERNHRKNS
ncbi:hypothetical protein ACFW04_010558 [Cataglyphis niger]